MTETDRIHAVVTLSSAFSEVMGSGDTALASKLGGEIERQLAILNPKTEAAPRPITDADALADLNGTPRPDNPSQ